MSITKIVRKANFYSEFKSKNNILRQMALDAVK